MGLAIQATALYILSGRFSKNNARQGSVMYLALYLIKALPKTKQGSGQ